ncbi:hypothetical protein L538_0345 [Bordetella hinzii 4161]|nr:hypothetical protein L543_0361 [Bordetella hinzii L60]KCB43289.1 hypothetical protein L538_0345 [Bordetella hinzii 4161]
MPARAWARSGTQRTRTSRPWSSPHSTKSGQSIVGAQLNLDGQVYDLSNARPFASFSDLGAATKESRKGFIVPTDLICRVVASQRA